ncbi:ABL087Wp [Eremothecium gossypii ATCC 10895]|uniref:ABL087Wp n=1 Tax=Eremothecium gossypii (strain ATCC 10895 / CBS 109.51 / FGSC 9923 / NRRL Y-1056) TaxID=284811 RepID=Q75DW0_EREGS|nr:ABL087Wp [Eremothecium gossypii ATCC 10895]AAS50684.1 ABL087Wp [Eremothecium gossypii ATCC 10895]AEY94972.1 FABL087Wp [Eremothecium gossypii FDAG1]
MTSAVNILLDAIYIVVTYVLPLILTFHTTYESNELSRHIAKGYSDMEALQFKGSQVIKSEDYLRQLEEVMHINLKICALSLSKCMMRTQISIYWCVYWLSVTVLEQFLYPCLRRKMLYASININAASWRTIQTMVTLALLIHTYEHPVERGKPLRERNKDRFWSIQSMLMKVHDCCLNWVSAALDRANVSCTPAQISALVEKGNRILAVEQHKYFDRGLALEALTKPHTGEKTVLVMDTQMSYDIVSTSECNSILSASSASSYSSAAVDHTRHGRGRTNTTQPTFSK